MVRWLFRRPDKRGGPGRSGAAEITPWNDRALRDPNGAAQPLTPGQLQRDTAAGLSFEVGVDSFFGASHAVRPDGERHTHSFRIQASFRASSVDEDGVLWHFHELRGLVEAEARRYANRFINEIEPFTAIQPTGENIAAVTFRRLAAAMAERIPPGTELVAVTLWENPTSYVRVAGVP